MLNWTFLEGQTLLQKLWLLFDKRAELDLRSTKLFISAPNTELIWLYAQINSSCWYFILLPEVRAQI